MINDTINYLYNCVWRLIVSKADFRTMHRIDIEKDYSEYEPQKYDCISVDDDYIDGWWQELVLIKNCYHCLKRLGFALSR